MISAWLSLCAVWEYLQRASHASLDIFFVISLNKLLSKQSCCQLLDTRWRSCDVTVIFLTITVVFAVPTEQCLGHTCEAGGTLDDDCLCQGCPDDRPGPYCERMYCFRDDSRFASSQWETALVCNGVFHWLGASLECWHTEFWPKWTPLCRWPTFWGIFSTEFEIFISIKISLNPDAWV